MSHEALFNLARTRYSKITTPTIARAHLHVSGYMMCVCVCDVCVCCECVNEANSEELKIKMVYQRTCASIIVKKHEKYNHSGRACEPTLKIWAKPHTSAAEV
jgi:hypothetical protein